MYLGAIVFQFMNLVVILFVLSLLFYPVYHIVQHADKKKEQTAMALWLVIVLAAPVIGGVVYLLVQPFRKS